MSKKVVNKVLEALKGVEDRLMKQDDFCEEDFDTLQLIKSLIGKMLFKKEDAEVEAEEVQTEDTAEMLCKLIQLVETNSAKQAELLAEQVKKVIEAQGVKPELLTGSSPQPKGGNAKSVLNPLCAPQAERHAAGLPMNGEHTVDVVPTNLPRVTGTLSDTGDASALSKLRGMSISKNGGDK